MAGVSIPGVSDKYKTNDLVEALMKQERLPLEREQASLDGYKMQQDAWRSVNKNVTALRDSCRSLYSFDNPFNSKIGESTNEDAVSVEAGRNAALNSFQIDVLNPATADRFLSGEIDKGYKVPAGSYVFKSGEKEVSMNWKGGTVQSFVDSLNKRSKDVIKASVITVSPGKQALMIEALQTGEANKLIFEEEALNFALDVGMIQKVKPEAVTISSPKDIKQVSVNNSSVSEQEGMPALSFDKVSVQDNTITVPPRGSFEVQIPRDVASDPNQVIEFSLSKADVEDITEKINQESTSPQLPGAGGIDFKGIHIDNFPSDTTLPSGSQVKKLPALTPVVDDNIVSLKLKDGTEVQLSESDALQQEDGSRKFSVALSDYDNLESIIVRNRNTGKEITMSTIQSFNKNANLGYEPINAASTASDAKIKYEGITITRPSNKIDDVVPDVTLNIKEKTDKTATITIKPDKETVKEYLITLVGTYNKAVAEMNILTQTKEEIIDELGYLTEDEVETYKEWLGIFQGDFTLTNSKSFLQTTMTSAYSIEENTTINNLAQIGISTSATSYSGYSPSKLRGYLEIDEKTLDNAIENNLNEIKNLFGYDSDNDLIIDSGIAYQMDQRLQSYVQSGGIFSTKISTLDTRISNSEKKIKTLESQLETKEQNLKQKYSQMESTLNSLESQSQSINNTFNKKQE